jgi:hypothetical protein
VLVEIGSSSQASSGLLREITDYKAVLPWDGGHCDPAGASTHRNEFRHEFVTGMVGEMLA